MIRSLNSMDRGLGQMATGAAPGRVSRAHGNKMLTMLGHTVPPGPPEIDPMAPFASNLLHPVILCGGVGSRLWPLSRHRFPKQFLPLHGERTMMQDTLARVPHGKTFTAPLFIANEDHRFLVAEQVRAAAAPTAGIMLEPLGRGTAAAVCAAALSVQAREPGGLMLVMPSDHVIEDTAAFHDAVDKAAVAAADGALVTFGITPTRAETGYGYIQGGAAWPDAPDCVRVDRFIEKPDQARAEAFLAEGGYCWNSGIFLFRADTVLDELRGLRPDILLAVQAAWDKGTQDHDFFRLERAAFTACAAESLDRAVMEHTDRAAMVPVSMGWNDVGAWQALWDLGEKDDHGNVARGDVLLHDVRNAYVRSDTGSLAAVVGLDDVVVVVSDDAVLVTARHRAQDVKTVVDRLQAAQRPEHRVHSTVYRPWGSFRSIDHGGRFQVKHITVNPGAKLSLQMHHHRAEHWVVVEGTARVTRGDKTFLLHENQSTYIPIGEVHRLENPGLMPLRLIEVQSGGYLGEDDIVRLGDDFGRLPASEFDLI